MKKKKKKRQKSVNKNLSVNLILIITGIVSVLLTRFLIEAKRQDEIRNIGYKINVYRNEIKQLQYRKAKLRSELEKIKKPDQIMSMLRKEGIKLSMPNLERTKTIKFARGNKRMAKR